MTVIQVLSGLIVVIVVSLCIAMIAYLYNQGGGS